jgi:hypothetical protein
MKKLALGVFALLLLALPLLASADSFFTLTGQVAKVQCTELPTFQAPPMLHCEMVVAPDPGFTSHVTVYCMDPAVAEACSGFQAGDPVMIFGHEVGKTKMVDKIGVWVTGGR